MRKRDRDFNVEPFVESVVRIPCDGWNLELAEKVTKSTNKIVDEYIKECRMHEEVKKRKQRQAEYEAMSPKEKCLKLLENLEIEMKTVDNTDCTTGRAHCIDCSLQELNNIIRDSWEEDD